MSKPDGIEIKSSALSGKGIFAQQSFSPGQILLSLDRPLIAALDQSRVEDTCSWCFRWTELSVLSGAGVHQATKVNWCTGCKKVKYCNKSCQSKAWKAAHKRECKMFAAQPELIPNTVIAVIQIMQGIDAADVHYKAVADLETHRDSFEHAGGQKWQATQLMAHTALKFMGEKENTPKLEHTRSAMCTLMCNSLRLVTATFDPLGLSLDPLVSRMNHSCSPNAIVVFDGPKLTVRALESIKKGTEILISYIDNTAPFGVRQAELKDQYFFTCSCPRCKSATKAPQDAFLKPGPDFDERMQTIDELIPSLKSDPAWQRHTRGDSKLDQRLSALEFYAYSFSGSPDTEVANPARLRKAIAICRNSGVFPPTRAPLPTLYQQYAVACLGEKRYNEALIAMIRICFVIDPEIYTPKHHPVRVVHAWTLATLAKAVSSDFDSPFCKALQVYGIDLSRLFLVLLSEVHEQVPESHGLHSEFGCTVEGAWRTMMEPGGELDVQYSQVGLRRNQWEKMLKEDFSSLLLKVKAFAEDESIAAQIDEAISG